MSVSNCMGVDGDSNGSVTPAMRPAHLTFVSPGCTLHGIALDKTAVPAAKLGCNAYELHVQLPSATNTAFYALEGGVRHAPLAPTNHPPHASSSPVSERRLFSPSEGP